MILDCPFKIDSSDFLAFIYYGPLLYLCDSEVRIYHIKEFITSFILFIDLIPWKGLGLLCDFIILPTSTK